MRISKLKLLFEVGDLLSSEIVTAPLEPGPKDRWIVEFVRRNGARVALSLDQKVSGRDQVRIFNSLDGAFSACRQIGFRGAKIQES